MNEWTRRTEPFSELSSQVAVSIKKKDPGPGGSGGGAGNGADATSEHAVDHVRGTSVV